MSYRSIVRLAACALSAALFVTLAPATALAHPAPGAASAAALASSARYRKPARTVHADTAPHVPGAPGGRPAPTGSLGASPLPGTRSALLDASAAEVPLGLSLSGSGSGGSNSISFAHFDDGDMVVVLDPASLTGHAGLFDSRFYSSIYSYAVISANVSPQDGVQREQCLKYRAYDRAYALWVPSQVAHAVQARNWAYGKLGKPYNLAAAKTDLRSFYCSKLCWGAWKYTSGLDLDADGGYWVWPVDLINSRYTTLFGSWS